MLTARGAEEDRIRGFEAGADDYVVKPFNVRELVLRVRALVHRVKPALDAAPSSRPFTFGGVRLDAGRHRVFVDDVELDLRPLEFKLLAMLLGNSTRVVTRTAGRCSDRSRPRPECLR